MTPSSSTHRVQLAGALTVLIILVFATCVMIEIRKPLYPLFANVFENKKAAWAYFDFWGRRSSSSTMDAKERVAVCFAGNMRTFYYEFVHETLLNLTIAPLRERYTTDVFFFVRLDDAPPLHKPAQANGPLSLRASLKFDPVNVTIVSNGTLDDATSEYLRSSDGIGGPFHHIVSADELRSMSSRVAFDNERKMDVLEAPQECGTRRRIRFPHTLMRSKQCLQMISEYEEKHGFTYDWIYRLRPDTVFLERVPLPFELNRTVAYMNQANPGASKRSALMWAKTRRVARSAGSAVNDQVMFSSRSIAETLLRAYDGVDDCESYHPTIAMWPPENTLRLWLMKRGIDYLAIPFAWTTILEYTGPTCEKLVYQNVPIGSDWKQALRLCYKFGQQFQNAFPETSNWTDMLEGIGRFKRDEKHMRLYYI